MKRPWHGDVLADLVGHYSAWPLGDLDQRVTVLEGLRSDVGRLSPTSPFGRL